MSTEKKLQVKNLTISFRTVNGKLQAVRDISFDLYKGETLAIVGESGSGKSATSKTILGISAANTIIEGGEVLYDGKDLLKISEEDFHSIRGDKIAMVFQDPLSSLNPIMRIGRQLTEAMLLKNKSSRRECKKAYRDTVKELESCVEKADGNSADKKETAALLSKFRSCVRKETSYSAPYATAHENAEAALDAANDMLTAIDKNAVSNVISECKELKITALGSIDRFVVNNDASKLKDLLKTMMSKARTAKHKKDNTVLTGTLTEIRDILEKAFNREKPDFLSLGVYADKKGSIPSGDVSAIAAEADEYKNTFVESFNNHIKSGVQYSFDRANEGKQKVIDLINANASVLEREELDKNEVKDFLNKLYPAVEESIDKLEPIKDSLAYTFKVSLNNAVDSYFGSEVKNVAEQKRFDKQNAKYEKLVKRGKTPEWKVVPLSLVDTERVKTNIQGIVNNLKDHYQDALVKKDNVSSEERTQLLNDYLREKAGGESHKITKSMAKDAAIKIMKQVGISEPRKRYKQYPFEFSGGMRQRIVIAISLTANPDILICDEPTTALDVTIQAQILELINNLKKQRNLSVIFITHDLGVVANMADRIAVMYAGKIVEYGTSDDVFYSPAHPYTWALLSSIPDLDSKEKLESIPGTPPNMIYPPKGDAFAARNKYAMEIDFEEQPPMFKISDTHYAATWLLHPDAPKVEMPEIVKERIQRLSNKTYDEGGTDNV